MRLIKQIIADIESENPYKVNGKHETYSQYNEGWSDCCGRFEFELERYFKDRGCNGEDMRDETKME